MQKTLLLLPLDPDEPLMNADYEDAGECELCLVDSPVYEFRRMCCRVRYIVGEPRLEVRRAWLDRWKKKNHVFGEKVEQGVKAKWGLKK